MGQIGKNFILPQENVKLTKITQEKMRPKGFCDGRDNMAKTPKFRIFTQKKLLTETTNKIAHKAHHFMPK